jgi:flagellar biosynthesis protein FliR
MNESLLFAFLLVFVRCSAMLMSSPVFGAQTTPLPIRIFTTLSISGALTVALQPMMAPPPSDLWGLGGAVLQEAVAGLLLGTFMTLVLQAAQIAGSLLDMQIGLGMSQVVNPVNGVSATVLGQFKHMLAVVVFLSVDAHHQMLAAFANSYQAMPNFSAPGMMAIQAGLVEMLGAIFLLALQIAAPVLAVSVVVDAALGVMNKAVPQMQALQLGMPAKTGIGLLTVGLTLPALTASVSNGLGRALDTLAKVFGG